MTPTVTAMGDVNVDVLCAPVEDYPEKDSQVLTDRIELTTGGCAANFAKAISHLGSSARLIGCVGDDLLGDLVEKELSALDLCLEKKGSTGITLALNFTDQTRSFITYPGANAEFSGFDPENIEGRCLHIASFFLQGLREKTRDLIELAHEKGMIVSFDCGWDPAGWSAGDRKLVSGVLEGVDIFFPNLREAEAITQVSGGKAACERLHELGVKTVALKMGKKGAIVSSGEEVLEVPAFKTEAVDTTGAGDVFDAAFVYSYLSGDCLEKCARFASAAASLSTRGAGSSAYPRLSEVLELI